MSACAFAQTSSSTQPWAATSQWSVAVTQGVLLGPMVVDSSGNLLVANTLVGFSAPTKILGGATRLSWVSKVNASATPVFGVQIGGVNVINPIAADSSGNILITGGAAVSGLPVTPNAYSQASSGDGSAFACKLSGTDGTPIFCTYLNSNQLSTAGIGSDAQGNIYILAGGPTNAIVTTPGALSLGDQNVVLLKLDPTGQKLLYAAALGGSGAETPTGLTVDADGNTYVIGVTSSTDFPQAASGAISTPSDAFVAKVDPTGSKILYASYGRAFDHPFALAVDPTGAAYVAGTVGTANLYVRKYSAGGTTMDYENVLAGTARSSVSGAAVDSAGVLTLVGDANGLDFPEQLPTAPCLALSEPYPASDAGGYMIRLAADGSVLQSTFLSAVQPSFRAYSGSVVSTQPGHGWLVQTTRDFTSVGVVQVGPLATPLSSVSIVCITEGASFTPGGIAPGEMISIFGTGLGPAAPQTFTLDSNGRIASTLAGVQVTFDGTPAPLLFVEDDQINAITPWELGGKSTTEMCVVYNGNKECVAPSVGVAAPAAFTSAQGNALALNQDGTLNSSSNPAPAGSIVSIYLTGLGPISPAPADGSIVQLPLPALVNLVQVSFLKAGLYLPFALPAELLYAGPAPLQVGGLFQINVRIPDGSNGIFELSVVGPGGMGISADGTIAVTPASGTSGASAPVINRAPRLKVM